MEQKTKVSVFTIVGFFLFALFTLVPLSAITNDHWDGVIIEHGLNADVFDGVGIMFYEVGGVFTFAFMKTVFLIDLHFLPVSWKAISSLGILVYLSGILALSYAILGTIRLPTALMMLTLPFSVFASSSMLGLVLLWIGLAAWGVYLLHTNPLINRLVGFALCCLGSQVFYILPPILALLLYPHLAALIDGKFSLRRFVEDVCICAILTTIFVLMFFIMFRAHGFYEGYSTPVELSFSLLKNQNLLVFVYPSVALFSLFFITAACTNGDFKKLVAPFYMICVLGACVLPFVLTGRIVHAPFEYRLNNASFEDWRYSPFWLPIFYLYLELLAKAVDHRWIEYVSSIARSTVILLHVWILTIHWSSIASWDANASMVISHLSNKTWKSNQICQLTGIDDMSQNYLPRFYDLHALAHKARGRQDNFICGSGCSLGQAKSWVETLCVRKEYQWNYIFQDADCSILSSNIRSATEITSCFVE